MRNHRIPSRPHLQGTRAPLRVRHSAENLTDGGGLIVIRRPWDALDLGSLIDRHAASVGGFFRPSLMVEVWVILLLYGGRVIDDLPLLDRRGIRRLFGWVRVPDPTIFSRWLRRAGSVLVPLLDDLLWYVVRRRWAATGGVPKRLTLVLDSTVCVRYGLKQAGAERGYNPKKPGRPSHHPLLVFIQQTGDCLGVRWRPGNAHTAAGAEAWLTDLVGRLRAAGVEEITVRLDKGFFSRSIARTLQDLDVHFLLKIPAHAWLRDHQAPWHRSAKGEDIFPGHELWTTSGTLWNARLLSIQTRRPLQGEDILNLDTYEVPLSANVLTNIEGIHALTAWRRYNQGAVIEQRIEELANSPWATRPSMISRAMPCSGASVCSPTRSCIPCALLPSRAPGVGPSPSDSASGPYDCQPSSRVTLERPTSSFSGTTPPARYSSVLCAHSPADSHRPFQPASDRLFDIKGDGRYPAVVVPVCPAATHPLFQHPSRAPIRPDPGLPTPQAPCRLLHTPNLRPDHRSLQDPGSNLPRPTEKPRSVM